jgi:hypothetical protein
MKEVVNLQLCFLEKQSELQVWFTKKGANLLVSVER